MGWETRSGHSYYYRKKRVGDRVISEYMGCDLLASLVEGQRRIDRYERHQHQINQQAQLAIDRAIDALCRLIRRGVKVALISTGHHAPKREWRKKRMSDSTSSEEMTAILKRLSSGKESKNDLAAYGAWLKTRPELWRTFGDLPRTAIQHTINQMNPDGQKHAGVFRRSIERGIVELKADYGYEGSSTLEKMLIEQIILCWLRLYWVENLFTTNLPNLTRQGVKHWEERLSANQRRFLRAITTLAQVRKLASRTPEILQVNIANQQVNQAG